VEPSWNDPGGLLHLKSKENPMQIDTKYKLEKAVGLDDTRPALQNIRITKRHAFVTNGHILAIVPIKTEATDTPGWLTPDAMKLGRKLGRHTGEITIHLDGKQVLADGTALPRPDEETPPKLFHILRPALQEKKKFVIGLNVKELKDLCDALGTEKVELSFHHPEKAVLVRPIERDAKEIGIIMPIRLNP
jgi:hypothetical protein